MSLFFVVTPYNLTVPLWSYRSLHFSGRFSVLFYNKLLLLSKIFKNQNRLRFHCNADDGITVLIHFMLFSTVLVLGKKLHSF